MINDTSIKYGINPVIHNKMKKILFILLITFTAFQVNANEALQDSIKKANKSYLGKDFEAAIKTYNTVVVLGYSSPELYYNLGNSYYKSDKIALAIVNFERALKLDPGFDDARYNIEMANKLIVDKIEIVPEFFLVTWFKALISLFSFDFWAYLSVVLFGITLVLASLYFFSRKLGLRKISFFLAIISLFFVIITFVFARKRYHYQVEIRTAIVYETSITVKSSPSESGTDIFPLHEGTKVILLDDVGEWAEIKIADGKQGWLKKESLLEI